MGPLPSGLTICLVGIPLWGHSLWSGCFRSPGPGLKDQPISPRAAISRIFLRGWVDVSAIALKSSLSRIRTRVLGQGGILLDH